VPHPEHVPLTVDVVHPQVRQLADPQATTVSDPHHESVPAGGHGVEESVDISRAEDHGKRAWLLAEDDEGDEVGPIEDVAVEEPQGAGDLVEQAPRGGLCDEVELEVAELFGRESVRGASEVLGGPCNGRDVGLDGAWRVVAAGEFVDEPLA
jgi:hypothetical protein